MPIRRRDRVFVLLITMHLGMVIVGAANVNLNAWGPLGHAIYVYGSVTGALFRYAFFAPGVGSDVRAEFDVFGADGKKTTEPLILGLNREAALRVNDVVEQFMSQRLLDPVKGRHEKLYRSL